MGHEVTLVYLPYAYGNYALNRFDQRRNSIYARDILSRASPAIKVVCLLDTPRDEMEALPAALDAALREVSIRDVQYTLQIEEFDPTDIQAETGILYDLRMKRNENAARAMLALLRAEQPDVVLTPNGSILETGAVYQAARSVETPVVTYEFGEQKQRIWLAKNDEVMHQDTTELWNAWSDVALSKGQMDRLHTLYASRKKASLWENFSRRWQGMPNQGGKKVKTALGLDSRPVVLLAANVIGDSLTLGRQVFTGSMTEWLERTIKFFAGQPEIQLVVRIHPGERYTRGPSVADLVRRTLPGLPDHIHLVPASSPTKTYDLVDIADLGLVYTTTVGLVMAMSGVPVIVAGQTHYRDRGFTLDPTTWEKYVQILNEALASNANHALSKAQLALAWNYAYRFFFEYPLPFPWQLHGYWDAVEEWPISRVLSAEGFEKFGRSFQYLTGAARDYAWSPAEEVI
jgi:hypothetical protein